MDNMKEIKRLIRKFNATHGMVNEIIMKAKLLKSKVQAGRRTGEPVTPELVELVNNSLIQYQSDLSKYQKKMHRISKRVEELCR